MAADVTVPNIFHGVTNSVADNVDADYAAIMTWLNTNAVHLDGTKAFTVIPSGPASNPTSADQLTRKSYADAQFNPSRVGVRRAAAQTVATGTAAAVSFDTEDVDNGGFISTPSSTLTVPTGASGLYALTALVTANVASASYQYTFQDAVGRWAAVITARGTTVSDTLSTYVYMAAGDAVQLYVQNTSGSSRQFVVRMTMIRIA